MIDDTSLIQRKPDLITADVEGESVVLNATTGVFYNLNTSAARIWDLLDTPQPIGGLVAQLVERFEVTPDQCRTDLLDLVESLRERGLVETG